MGVVGWGAQGPQTPRDFWIWGHTGGRGRAAARSRPPPLVERDHHNAPAVFSGAAIGGHIFEAVCSVTLELSVPQVRDCDGGPYHPSLFARWERSERALLVACGEMYFQGVSTRNVREVLDAMCEGVELSAMTVSRVAAEIDGMALPCDLLDPAAVRVIGPRTCGCGPVIWVPGTLRGDRG